MADKMIRDQTLSDIADAIREKSGTSGSMVFPQGFISTLDGIPTDGYKIATGTISYPSKTAVSSSNPFTMTFSDFTQLQGAILMCQKTSSTSRNLCIMSLATFGGNFDDNYYGLASYNTRISTNALKLNGNVLSLTPATTVYFYETYFYMVWGN